MPGVDFEAVAVNHHTDWPESYEYLEMMLAKGYPVTVIEPDVGGFSDLYKYCLRYAILPSRFKRWCTSGFKVQPLLDYFERPCVDLIGFDALEIRRARGMREKEGVVQEYPLIEAGIDRKGCMELIARHGLPLPTKSGCFICPFQSKHVWIEMRRTHPDLFCKARTLEELFNDRRTSKSKSKHYFRDKPLDLIVQETQVRMWDDRPPCRCGL